MPCRLERRIFLLFGFISSCSIYLSLFYSSSGLCSAGFYGGVGWQLLGRLSTLGARFGVYELSCAFITGAESLATWLASEYVVSLYVQIINGLSLNV